jgi:Mn-dependent DtxR family transcriptional regulator
MNKEKIAENGILCYHNEKLYEEVFVMEIRESAEDYLEAILRLSKKGDGVRSIDIATMLNVSKPSVSHAMKLLREDGYIAMDRYGTITLLDKGAAIAGSIYERHTVLAGMLEALGVSPDVALADACKLEHDLSDESFSKIKEHFQRNVKVKDKPESNDSESNDSESKE